MAKKAAVADKKKSKSNKLKIKNKKESLAKGEGKKRPGRPATKKPVVGWEVSSKDQNKIANEFSNAQKMFDSIGESVSKFAFDAAPKSAMDAVREIIKLQGQMKTMCKTIRVIKKGMKPKFGELPA
jgi:hypothetical protein